MSWCCAREMIALVTLCCSDIRAACGEGPPGEDGDPAYGVPQLLALPPQGHQDIHAHAHAEKGGWAAAG